MKQRIKTILHKFLSLVSVNYNLRRIERILDERKSARVK